MAGHDDQPLQLTQLRERVLEEFGIAWTKRDIPKLMSIVTDDCVYCASVGPEPGQSFIGRDAVQEGFRALLAHDAGGESREGRCVVLGEIGIAEWSYVYNNSDGATIEVRGCDILQFRGVLICRKDAFRKCFGQRSAHTG